MKKKTKTEGRKCDVCGNKIEYMPMYSTTINGKDYYYHPTCTSGLDKFEPHPTSHPDVLNKDFVKLFTNESVEQSKEEQCECLCHGGSVDIKINGVEHVCTCKPKTVISKSSKVDPDKITYKPGMYFKTEDTGETKLLCLDKKCPIRNAHPLNKDWGEEWWPKIVVDQHRCKWLRLCNEMNYEILKLKGEIESARASERKRVIEKAEKKLGECFLNKDWGGREFESSLRTGGFMEGIDAAFGVLKELK